MPEIRPGRAFYFTADKVVAHGAPVHFLGRVGIAIKSDAYPAGTGLGAAAITDIAIGERSHIETMGRVLVDNLLDFEVGDDVDIDPATNLLVAGGAGVAFGSVAEVEGDRGCPAGKMRVDLVGVRVTGS
jgi:hypothetical protein